MDILRQRVLLVQERTRYLNRQHGILEKYDHTIKAGSCPREAPDIPGTP